MTVYRSAPLCAGIGMEMVTVNFAYKRILLKISGEVLSGENGSGYDYDVVKAICQRVKTLSENGVQVGIVVGGGNFWRGRSSGEMDRTKADHMGMLATVMNSIMLQDTLMQMGVQARVLTAVNMEPFAEYYMKDRAVRYLEKGRVCIFGAGTGNPFFSTDTGAALRGVEIGADVILKATNVDGVYDKDPNKYPDAVKYDEITHEEAVIKNLKVMDSTAFSICRDSGMKILVFNLNDYDNIIRAAKGESIGTIVK